MLGFVVMPSIRSSASFRYGNRFMLKGSPAMTFWIGFAPEPGDGDGLGTPDPDIPDCEGGSTFEVGMEGCDSGGVPDSPAVGETDGALDDAPVSPPWPDEIGDDTTGDPIVGTAGDVATDGELETPLVAGGCTLGDPPVKPACGDEAAVDLGERGTEEAAAGEDTRDDT